MSKGEAVADNVTPIGGNDRPTASSAQEIAAAAAQKFEELGINGAEMAAVLQEERRKASAQNGLFFGDGPVTMTQLTGMVVGGLIAALVAFLTVLGIRALMRTVKDRYGIGAGMAMEDAVAEAA